MNKKVFAFLAILVLASMLMTACGGAATEAPAVEEPAAEAPAAEEAPAEEPAAVEEPAAEAMVYTVGAVHDLSGATAVYGESIKKGIDLAVSEINAQAYLGEGATLEVIYEDAAGDATQAIAAFEKLIANDAVSLILGPTLSSEAKSADPIAQEAGMPVVASSNTATGITDIGNFIFRTSLPESLVIPNTINVTKEALGLTKVAVMYGNDDAFTQSGYEVFVSALNDAGIEILTEETFAKGDTDFSAQLTKIMSMEPDAIVVSALAEEAANIMVQARTLGITAPFIGGNGFNSPKLAEIAGGAAEGAISGAAWNIASTVPASADFVAAFNAEYGADPDQFAAQAYTAAWAAANALKEAGADRAGVRDALDALEGMDSPLGTFGFDDNRDPAHPPVVLVVQDGVFAVFQP